MTIECDAEGCDNVAVWVIPYPTTTMSNGMRKWQSQHLCHAHHQELLCSDQDCNDPECRVHGYEIRIYGSKQ